MVALPLSTRATFRPGRQSRQGKKRIGATLAQIFRIDYCHSSNRKGFLPKRSPFYLSRLYPNGKHRIGTLYKPSRNDNTSFITSTSIHYHPLNYGFFSPRIWRGSGLRPSAYPIPCVQYTVTELFFLFYQVVNAPHKAQLSHELIAAAASYEVTLLYCHLDRWFLIDDRLSGCQGIRETKRHSLL